MTDFFTGVLGLFGSIIDFLGNWYLVPSVSVLGVMAAFVIISLVVGTLVNSGKY